MKGHHSRSLRGDDRLIRPIEHVGEYLASIFILGTYRQYLTLLQNSDESAGRCRLRWVLIRDLRGELATQTLLCTDKAVPRE